MSTLATINGAGTSLADALNYDEATLKAAAQIIAPDAPPHIIKLVLYRCAQLGCDPLGKNIYAINRPRKTGAPAMLCPKCNKAAIIKGQDKYGGGWLCWTKKEGCGAKFPDGTAAFENAPPAREDNWVLQTSIDLFRSIAESSDGYAGQQGPFWCGPDGVWRDVWLADAPPSAAKVGIIRSKFSEPMFTVARFASYVQTDGDGKPTGLWAKMPEVMIAKCAEGLGIRKAFPAKLSGLYIAEEMQQADSVDVEPKVVLPVTQAAKALVSVREPTLEETLVASVRQKKLEQVSALAARLRVTPAKIGLDLEAVGNDADALIAHYEELLKNPPAARGKTAPAAEPIPAVEPVAPIVDAEPSAEKKTRAKRDKPMTKPEWAASQFRGTPFENDVMRHSFAAQVLNWENVSSFNDLEDKDCERVVTALHLQLEKMKAIDAEIAAEKAALEAKGAATPPSTPAAHAAAPNAGAGSVLVADNGPGSPWCSECGMPPGKPHFRQCSWGL